MRDAEVALWCVAAFRWGIQRTSWFIWGLFKKKQARAELKGALGVMQQVCPGGSALSSPSSPRTRADHGSVPAESKLRCLQNWPMLGDCFAIQEGLCHAKPILFFKKALNSRLASLLMVFKAAGVQPLPCPTRVGGRGFAAQVGEWLRLVLARPCPPSGSASRAEDTPSQRERSPPSFSVIRSKFYLYVCFFSHADGQHRWLGAVVCIAEPSKSFCPGSASKRAGSPRSTWAVAICKVGSLFHKLPAVGLHHKLAFKVWLWSEKSQRATVKLTS